MNGLSEKEERLENKEAPHLERLSPHICYDVNDTTKGVLKEVILHHTIPDLGFDLVDILLDLLLLLPAADENDAFILNHDIVLQSL